LNNIRARKGTKNLSKISTNTNRKSNVNAENHISGIESINITFSKFIKVNRTTEKCNQFSSIQKY
jgi:hypothetical protein